ncbi:MAG: hypothetical protein HY675_05550 [Chloroflexi bacterium]|nr:hypothetical protein [Chloroflexota bacterium]
MKNSGYLDPVNGQRMRLFVSVLLLLVAVSTGITTATGAMFTDSQAVASNTFSTGTVDVSTSPTSALVTFAGMAPGDKKTAAVTVSNSGSLAMRYALRSTTTEDSLATALSMTVKTGVTSCTDGGFGTDGTVIYGPDKLGAVASRNIIGDPTEGAQSGDRSLNASASEALCFQVTLPITTGNSIQGLNTTATLDFSAEQTTNN